jgi:hypothetical protein
MTNFSSSPDSIRATEPHCFEIRVGVRRIACNVSDDVLHAVIGLPDGSTPTQRRRAFDRFRMLIDAAAKLKLGLLPADFGGPLALSSLDLRAVPPASETPVLGSASGST